MNLRKHSPYPGMVRGVDADGSPLVEHKDFPGVLYSVDPKQAATGDEVSFSILNMKKREARVLEVTAPSAIRRSPACMHFGRCGGCSLQHLPYGEQCAAKESMVRQTLDLPGLPEPQPIIPCDREFEYRNKMEYTFSSRAWQEDAGTPVEGPGALGLFVPYSGNKVLDLSMCRLQAEPATRLRNWCKAWARENSASYYHSNTHTGFLRTLLVRLSASGQTLVMPVVAIQEPSQDALLRRLMTDLAAAFPDINSLWYCINNKLNDSYGDLSPVHHSGAPWIEEEIAGFRFRVGPLSFMQVNPWQTARLYDTIVDLAGIRPDDLVYDLYCGAGTISSWAARRARRVVGLEYVQEAVDAARQTAELNNIHNCEFHAGDMRHLLSPAFIGTHGVPDVIITDPPRAGMHPDVTKLLCTLRPRTLIYVACKTSSLRRDLEVLGQVYKVTRIQPVDLMPQTTQIETLAVLEPR